MTWLRVSEHATTKQPPPSGRLGEYLLKNQNLNHSTTHRSAPFTTAIEREAQHYSELSLNNVVFPVTWKIYHDEQQSTCGSMLMSFFFLIPHERECGSNPTCAFLAFCSFTTMINLARQDECAVLSLQFFPPKTAGRKML